MSINFVPGNTFYVPDALSRAPIEEGSLDEYIILKQDNVNKQINDKERIAAAMENPNLKEMVENCILEED
ncbi:hypothetical protein JTB14_021843 [Gonioctena quinquepunctata]|nr:hypothetical protein JTB14_021843 [Gonioctena quinquepunctata]